MTPLRKRITAEQAENIEILAKFLIKGELSGGFDMGEFVVGQAYEVPNICGTVACALGYAPEALGTDKCAEYICRWYLLTHKACEYNFTNLSEELLGMDADDEEWEYAFESLWDRTDNTPFGAGQRLLYLLNKGLPDTWREEMGGTAPQSWEVKPYTL